jgi:hypothetical protein
MIQTLFIAKQEYDKRRKAGELPAFVDEVVRSVRRGLEEEAARLSRAAVDDAFRFAGFTKTLDGGNPSSSTAAIPPATRSDGEFWFEAPQTQMERTAARLIAASASGIRSVTGVLGESERRLADYVTVRELGFPPYAGGPFAVLARLDDEGLRRILQL